MAKSAYPVQDFLYRHVPWLSIFYARKYYGYEWTWLVKTWLRSSGGQDKTFGGTKSRAEDFFSRCAHQKFEDSTLYRCVNGNCTIIWHPKLGNTGGSGRPGCSCEDMDDPRDLERGPLK